MNKKYFKLNPECYLVLGKKKSIIHNLLNAQMIWLDEENTIKLTNAEANKLIDSDDSTLNHLVKKGWGFFSDRPVFVDKLRTINAFNQKKLWKDTQNISLASIQVTNECNLNCSFCKSSFCPTCKTFENQPNDSQLSLEKYKSLIDELNFFGATNIVFTGGEPAMYEYINELIEYSLSKNINTSVHTNGLIKINNLPIKTNIIVTLFDSRHLDKIVENYSNNPNVTLISSEETLTETKGKIDNWKIVKTYRVGDKKKITKNSLTKVGLEKYFAKKLSDSCLNGKIAIAYNGDVYPCFCSNTPMLNLKQHNLSDAIKLLISEHWKSPLENAENMTKCSLCEYKYSCNTCKFVNVDECCSYNLEEGKWM